MFSGTMPEDDYLHEASLPRLLPWNSEERWQDTGEPANLAPFNARHREHSNSATDTKISAASAFFRCIPCQF
ncbi:hypothetical protein LshimejAT787_1401710 [Lyophyllum shimeji]|uniref:Uncharacterized protein n=1 Tax=Lyophyllum shimeji TaxID=47721 RepID=A0A9P3UQ96_LYOSH|nr:hypothetical protein LshimejAT787_1401710 [Lyophyllum shimeji]